MEYILGGKILTTVSVLSPNSYLFLSIIFSPQLPLWSLLPKGLLLAISFGKMVGKWVCAAIRYLCPTWAVDSTYRHLVVTSYRQVFRSKHLPAVLAVWLHPSSFPSSVNSLTWSWSVLLESFQELWGGWLRALTQGREGSGQIELHGRLALEGGSEHLEGCTSPDWENTSYMLAGKAR